MRAQTRHSTVIFAVSVAAKPLSPVQLNVERAALGRDREERR